MEMGEVLEKYKDLSLLLGKRVTIKPKRREDPEGYEAEAIGLNDQVFIYYYYYYYFIIFFYFLCYYYYSLLFCFCWF